MWSCADNSVCQTVTSVPELEPLLEPSKVAHCQSIMIKTVVFKEKGSPDFLFQLES